MDPQFPNISEVLEHIQSRLKTITTRLQMDPGYDYNRFIPDPDEVFSELINNFNKVLSQIHDTGNQFEQSQKVYERYEAYLREAIMRMVHTSNAFENAGAGLNVTRRLVQDILEGKVMLQDIGEGDSRYGDISGTTKDIRDKIFTD